MVRITSKNEVWSKNELELITFLFYTMGNIMCGQRLMLLAYCKVVGVDDHMVDDAGSCGQLTQISWVLSELKKLKLF